MEHPKGAVVVAGTVDRKGDVKMRKDATLLKLKKDEVNKDSGAKVGLGSRIEV